MIDSVKKEADMLERHLEVLQMVIEYEPIGIVKTSNELGYAHHEVRYSLQKLEEANLINPSQQGAVTTAQTTHSSRTLTSRSTTSERESLQ